MFILIWRIVVINHVLKNPMDEIYIMHQLTSMCTSALDEIYLQVKGCPP